MSTPPSEKSIAEQPMIPYIAYESALARNERTAKRLIVSLIICILLLMISNLAWLYAWCQFEYVAEDTTTTTTVTQDGEGQNVYGDNNRVNDGAEDSNKEPNKTQKNAEEKR